MLVAHDGVDMTNLKADTGCIWVCAKQMMNRQTCGSMILWRRVLTQIEKGECDYTAATVTLPPII